MTTKRKIAFVKYRSFSNINESVRTLLGKQFPEHEIITFDVEQMIRRRLPALLRCAMSAAKSYKMRLREDPADALIQNPAAFQFIKRQLRSLIEPREFAFSFQTQSMWDAAVPGLPHFVYTDHTELANLTYPDFDHRRLKGKWWFDLEKRIYANAARTFTMSSHVTRSVVDDYGCGPSKVARVGAGPNAAVALIDTDPTRHSRKEILFVGTEWERKGGPQLVEAFRIVLRSHPEARLTIAGCTPAVDLPNCTVLGRVPLANVAELYQRASVFCLPTRNEPFGIAFIEAMLAGLPVVATNIGAVPDLVEDGVNGRRVDVDDVAELARALTDLLGDAAKLNALAENAAATARKNYTWESVGAKMKIEIERSLGTRAADRGKLCETCAS